MTRDSLTEKQMLLSEWMGTNKYASEIAFAGGRGELEAASPEFAAYESLINGIFREWENSYYQYEQGLFDHSEFEPRRYRWARGLRVQGTRDNWANWREAYSPRFRAEIDKIVAEIEAEFGAE